MVHTERFAPSPTGELHLGHAFSALTAWEAARAAGGRFLLRLEDLDRGRVRPEFADAILDDLAWLGIGWAGEVMVQSERGAAHADALGRLETMGLTYRCRCTRRDIREAAAAPQEGAGPDGPVYPGTCRDADVSPDEPHAIRLRMAEAEAEAGAPAFTELDAGPEGESGRIAVTGLAATAGDIVLRRRDGAMAYHLAVVVDDAAQSVTHVTRGRDLFGATPVHRLLQALLGLPEPLYRHHRLIRDAGGRRLAKRDRDLSLTALRGAGASPADIRRMVGL